MAKKKINKKVPKAKAGYFLQVDPKQLTYEDLPCIGCKDKLMAAAGMYMDPGPRYPGLPASIRDMPMTPSIPQQVYDPSAIITTAQLPAPDTSKVVPGKPLGPKQLQPPKQKGDGKSFNAANLALAAGIAFDSILPNRVSKQQVVQPQMAYNPMPYGYGSQALMEHGGYIMGEDENNSPSAKNGKTMKSKKKIKKYDDGGIAPALFGLMDTFYGELGNAKQGLMNAFTGGGGNLAALTGGGGGLSTLAGVMEQGGEIEAKDGHWIQKAVNPKHKGYCTPMTKSTCTPRRKALAKTFKKHHGFHKEGGIIPDNMSVFSPHRYEQGGNVNGGAKINMVDEKCPNTDLMEQWLLYANGGDLKPSAVKDSENRMYLGNKKVKVYNTGRDRDIKYNNDGTALAPMGILDYNPASGYNANIPEPGYSPANLDNRSNYSATFPQGSGQQTSYFPDANTWQSFVNSNPNLLISSQQGVGRGSAALKNRPMETGGNVNGGAKLKEVGATYPNTDMLEQWLLYVHGGNVNGGADIREVGAQYPNADLMEQWLLYKDGGTLSSDKAKEMLRDGTAHGKKLTAKQKRYFGMVAGGKAAFGTEIGLSGDPKPKKSTDPSTVPEGSEVNWNARRLANGQIDKDAYVEDQLLGILGNNYDPFNKEGTAYLNSIPDQNFAQQAGVRIKQIQGSNANYATMTPEQRINAFYQSGATGTTPVDDFIRRTRGIGGNPSAYWQNHPGNTKRVVPTVTFKNGGVMYDDGGQIDTMWGGNADLESYNPYDGGTVEFSGDSHAQGGIGMAYNGNPVEVEGGEYASKDNDGNLTIYGNMLVPGTKTKFKKAASAIADREKRYDMLTTKGSDLVNGNNPANRFDLLKFNAGKVMMQGGQMGMADLATKKEKLASLQRAMLDMAEQHGLDPHAMSQGKMKKAKGGASIPFYQNGGDPDSNDPTRADRNNNPGNIKYGKFAKKYGAKQDKDGFAIFSDRETGLKAMRGLLTSDSYKNMSASEAIKKWTDGHPYRYDLGPLTDKKISEMGPDELDLVMGTMQKGEGTRYGMTPRPIPKGTPTPNTTARIPQPGPFTPYAIPDMGVTPEVPQARPVNPESPYDRLNVPDTKKLPSNVERLKFNQLLPELYAMATNKVEPVPAQRYEPQLYTPYQVSFQDRLNQNQAGFNAQMKGLSPYNPSAMGSLAAQKYQADQAVLGDQFRTNQSIANDITNKNISLVNDANLKNLGLADTQMVRQSEARSKTRALNQTILNSISSKYAQNELENKRLAAYENLYDYRFVPQDDGGLSATYFGPNAMFNYNGRNSTGQKPQDVRTISRYDAAGNLKGYNEYDESDLKEMQRRLDMEIKRRKEPLLQLAPLK